jgi:endonuclease YncB( thermonuclease family)
MLFLNAAAPALADPCKAIPDRGPMPAHLAPGKTFSGPVVYIGDGDSLCVAVGPMKGDWVEVRLTDFYAPELSAPGGREAKAALERIAMDRRVECVAQHRSYDRVVAVCTVRGVSLGDRMRAVGIAEGGRGG